ncbi:Fatty acyl-CoA reductase 1 [Danaus plexippus plexippus]|uniref:Fatty acyl-CoA reductase 1 n=1 Tax=Danaus plexippus plexippus TaxID=278856 RepID=A0A212F4P6_DANPL|nr:Fatty acyl-CoA reductase 1 [Danaus plexippus plexippus]
MTASRSLTETHRNADVGKTKLDRMALQFVRETEGNVPLVHVTFQQPNFYYRKRRKQKTIQISLFNAWFGLGAGPNSTSWNAPLMITANGTNDPVTDIPPALATLRIDLASGEKYVNTYPHLMVLWYPGGNIRSYWITHQINLVLTHILPAYFIDFLLLLFRKKPLRYILHIFAQTLFYSLIAWFLYSNFGFANK